MKQRFFKLNSRWYADVPGHTLEENEMVCGADSILEEISRFLNSPEVTLDLDIEPSDFPFATLKQIEHDDCGATYMVESSLNTDLVWICNVTHDVLGEHPEIMQLASSCVTDRNDNHFTNAPNFVEHIRVERMIRAVTSTKDHAKVIAGQCLLRPMMKMLKLE